MPSSLTPSHLWTYDATLCTQGNRLIGVDEAGRGALAGPVMAAAVLLETHFFESEVAQAEAGAINDSKQLSADDREAQYAILLGWRKHGLIRCAWAPGSVDEIATHDILGATCLAMARSLEALGIKLPTLSDDLPLFSSPPTTRQKNLQSSICHPQCQIIVDGRTLKRLPYMHQGIIKGDGTSLCIAAASILAKVERDRLMIALCKQHPGYGFAQHKGYGTKSHRAALAAHGPCPQHRALFLRKILACE